MKSKKVFYGSIKRGDIFYANGMFWIRDFLNICVCTFGKYIYFTQFNSDEKVTKIIREKNHDSRKKRKTY